MPNRSHEEQKKDSNGFLGCSIIYIASLQACNYVWFRDTNWNKNLDLGISLLWATMLTIIGSIYYFLYLLKRICFDQKVAISPERERLAVYKDVPTESDELGMDSVEGGDSSTVPQVTDVALPPAMSPMNVLLYAYGWGLMLFVGLYCVSGVYMPGTSWWCLGFLVLSLDELVAEKIGRAWVTLIISFIIVSILSVWWGVLGQYNLDQSIQEIFAGIIAPALSPFMFYFLRMNPEIYRFRGASGLLQLALPFMFVLSVCILIIQGLSEDQIIEDSRPRRRLLSSIVNNSLSRDNTEEVFIKTHAPFSNDTRHITPTFSSFSIMSNVTYITQDYYTLEKIIAVAFAPFPALGVFFVAVRAVVHNCATEVVVALTLCSSVRFLVNREYDFNSAMAIAPAALSFISIILLRRTK